MNKTEELLKANSEAVGTLLDMIKESATADITDTELFEQLADTIVAYKTLECKLDRLQKITNKHGIGNGL